MGIAFSRSVGGVARKGYPHGKRALALIAVLGQANGDCGRDKGFLFWQVERLSLELLWSIISHLCVLLERERERDIGKESTMKAHLATRLMRVTREGEDAIGESGTTLFVVYATSLGHCERCYPASTA